MNSAVSGMAARTRRKCAWPGSTTDLPVSKDWRAKGRSREIPRRVNLNFPLLLKNLATSRGVLRQ